MKQITPEQLLELKADENKLMLLDVREPWEFDICSIDMSKNIPMNQVPSVLDDLDKTQAVAVICHHGMRSLQIAQFLETNGFEQVFNLQGGIHAWAEQIDADMPRY